MHSSHKLLLFLLLGSVGQNALGAKIIHGSKVPDNSMLYMASVQEGEKHICGGFLVSEDFVLTAAHCNKATSVVLGTHRLSYATKDMRYNVKMCPHPNYLRVGKGDDIMLLKLSRKAKLSDSVEIINVTREQEPIDKYAVCKVAGWGYTKSHGSVVNDLQQVIISIINDGECKKKWGDVIPSHSIICAGGYKTNKGFCQADSGGPLVCNNVPVGVVSFNRDIGHCDYPDLPNIYTKISDFQPWIKEVLDKNGC